MDLSSNFSFDSSSIIIDPMQDQLKSLYDTYTFKISKAQKIYSQLKQIVPGIMNEDNNPPSVEDVDLVNADLGQLLVALNDGGINFDALGSAAFGMSQSGFNFDPITGQLKTLPLKTINQLIKWVQNAIQLGTNEQYLNSILVLGKLMNCINKDLIEKILVLIDSIKSVNAKPYVDTSDITKALETAGLSFTEDPDISLIDSSISELFVQKHLVTTKLYNAIEKQLILLGGYSPTVYNEIQDNLNTPYHYEFDNPICQ